MNTDRKALIVAKNPSAGSLAVVPLPLSPYPEWSVGCIHPCQSVQSVVKKTCWPRFLP
jgi:hypothetical protein